MLPKAPREIRVLLEFLDHLAPLDNQAVPALLASLGSVSHVPL